MSVELFTDKLLLGFSAGHRVLWLLEIHNLSNLFPINEGDRGRPISFSTQAFFHHWVQLEEPSFVWLIRFMSSSTCIFHVFFQSPSHLFSATAKSSAFLINYLSVLSYMANWPYHLLAFPLVVLYVSTLSWLSLY